MGVGLLELTANLAARELGRVHVRVRDPARMAAISSASSVAAMPCAAGPMMFAAVTFP
jgi:hypothetical protein